MQPYSWWGAGLAAPFPKTEPLLSDLRVSINFGPLDLKQLLLIRSSPHQQFLDPPLATGMSKFSLGVTAFRGMTANSCIFDLFITDIG